MWHGEYRCEAMIRANFSECPGRAATSAKSQSAVQDGRAESTPAFAVHTSVEYNEGW